MDKPYSAGYRNCERAEDKAQHCVDGPGNGFGYYGGTLWPSWSLLTKKEAEIAAEMCNEAYKQGYAKAQANIRKELGL